MCGRGLAGRERATNIEGAGPQLSDDQQRSHPGNESSEGSVSQLGNFVFGAASLHPASSHRVVEQDWRSGRAPIAGRLTWLSKSSSGGVFPNSVALSGDLVYVLNKNGATPNITGFRLDTSGTLHWIATVPLPPGSAGANDVRFSPDGTRLLLTESGTNEILVFPIASEG